MHTESRFQKLSITFVHQSEQRGTGHAARCAMDSPLGRGNGQIQGAGPGPAGRLAAHDFRSDPRNGSAARPNGRLAPVDLPVARSDRIRPGGAPGKKGTVLRIVEGGENNVREKSIREVAASIYMFQSAFLKVALHRLSDEDAQGEYYLTDLVAQASRAGKKIDVLMWAAHEDLRGVNDPWELSLAHRFLNERIIRRWAKNGVRFLDPNNDLGRRDGGAGRRREDSPRGHPAGEYPRGCRRHHRPERRVEEDLRVGAQAHVKTGTVEDFRDRRQGAGRDPTPISARSRKWAKARRSAISWASKKAKIGATQRGAPVPTWETRKSASGSTSVAAS